MLYQASGIIPRQSVDSEVKILSCQWDKTFILTMTEEGLWSRYPMLDKYDFQIIEGANRGLNVKDIKEEFELKIAEKTIYKRLKKLKDDGIIKSKKEENNY